MVKKIKNLKILIIVIIRFLHNIENSKLLLLTGTPMYDTVTELPGLLNLILPENSQLPTGSEFNKKYINSDGTINNQKELLSTIVGRVSYIREGGEFPKRIDIGESFPPMQFLKIYLTNMSDLQLKGYEKAYQKDTTSDEKGLWNNSRQAITFIYKKSNGDYIWGAKASNLLMKKTKKKILLRATGKQKTLEMSDYSIQNSFSNDIKENIATYSSKYAYLIEESEKYPDSPIFIFTPHVSGAGGAIFFSCILKLFGYTRATGIETTPGKRFAVVTGDDSSELQRQKIIDIFNSSQNRNGELIHIVIATMTIAVGVSFTNVKREYVLSPYWNNSATEQAIGRGLRADSLRYIPYEERKIFVTELAGYNDKLNFTENIDLEIYKLSEDKDVPIKHGERILKKAAWDCPLNYSRNVPVIDQPDTRICDYQKCNYSCYQVKPTVKPLDRKWEYTLTNKELNKSTYLLYYSRPDILKIAEKIKIVLQKFGYIDITDLYKYFKGNNFKLLVLSIEYLIENNIPILNKWGSILFSKKFW